MVQAWRPEKVQEFVDSALSTQAAVLDVFYAVVLVAAYGIQPVDHCDEDDAHAAEIELLRVAWGELSPWERLNAFIKIRDLTNEQAKLTFEVLNREAREADREADS